MRIPSVPTFHFLGDCLVAGPDGRPGPGPDGESAFVRWERVVTSGVRTARIIDLDHGWVPTQEQQLLTLRQWWGLVPDAIFATGAWAYQIAAWHRTHRHCGRCGAVTAEHAVELANTCPDCGLVIYPRVNPVVIVAVEDGNRLLLTRAHRHPAGLYSVVAGFVEPGETLEQAVAREVLEETGVSVDAIRYFGSQAWPFPHSLMVGFTARATSLEITVDPAEIAEGAWFHVDSLPSVPSPMSIARSLIEDFVRRHEGNPSRLETWP